ncbi:MAG: glycoside hydrolase family 2 protein, partial [Candidatus Binatia bacterium]
FEFPTTPFAEMPFGKQSWYGPLSGIWQSVYLERRIADHVTTVRVRSSQASGEISAQVRFESPLTDSADVTIKVVDAEENAVAQSCAKLAAGVENALLYSFVPAPRCWSPDGPYLYRLQVSMRRKDVVVDQIETTFGFRSVETRDGKLYLNGKPFYLRAALDQDYYPDTICTLPSVEFLEDRFHKAKQLGLNALRCHIKVPDPRYYEVADRLGLLIWAELPNAGDSTELSRERKELTLKGLIDRDGNHPSIFCWTLINENWGVDLVHDAYHRAWLKKLYLWLKSYDPSRLVVDNSPLAPSFHVQTDLADFHFYAAIPDSREDWDQFVEELAGRAEWLFSPEGDAVITGQEPLLCSEFGNWGLPDPEKLRDAAGAEAWWFETGHDWSEGVMYAHGVRNRFQDWSLDRVFGTFESFVEATQWQQFRALKYQIEAMRRRPQIAGYVITELTDCHWEANGLLDMRSNPRVFHNLFHSINADTVILPTLDRPAYWSGDAVHLSLCVAHGGPNALEAAALDISLTEPMTLEIPSIEPGVVADLGMISVNLPVVEHSCLRRLTLRLRSLDGRLLANNEIDIAVHARPRPPELSLWSSHGDIRDRLQALGYRLAEGAETADVVVETHASTALATYVRAGGRAVLLTETPGSLTPFFPHWQNVKVVARDGTLWRGDWASSFSWLRRQGPFAAIPGGPLLDQAFDRVIPTHIISGCNLLDFQARVHAALVVGWIHRPAAIAVGRNYGTGRIVIATFKLFRDPPGEDPTAAALLGGLIEAAARSAGPAPAISKLEPVGWEDL